MQMTQESLLSEPPQPAEQQEIFHYTSQLVEYSDLSPAERRSIINLKDDPFLSRFVVKVVLENNAQ